MVTCYTIISHSPTTISKLFSLEKCSPSQSAGIDENKAECCGNFAWSPKNVEIPYKTMVSFRGCWIWRGKGLLFFSLRNPNMNVVMIPFPDLLTGDIHHGTENLSWGTTENSSMVNVGFNHQQRGQGEAGRSPNQTGWFPLMTTTTGNCQIRKKSTQTWFWQISKAHQKWLLGRQKSWIWEISWWSSFKKSVSVMTWDWQSPPHLKSSVPNSNQWFFSYPVHPLHWFLITISMAVWLVG